LTEPSLHAHPESGKGDGAAGAHPLTSGGAQVLGLIFKELPTISADEANFHVDVRSSDLILNGVESFRSRNFIYIEQGLCKVVWS
jgi:hypothetical protein